MLSTFVASILIVGVAGEDRGLLSSVLRELYLGDTCPTCPRPEDTQTAREEQVKKYRIEHIKNSILESLGLSQPPKIDKSRLPKTFKTSAFLKKFHQSNYGNERKSTEKILLIPQDVTCDRDNLVEMEELWIILKFVLSEPKTVVEVFSSKVWLDAEDVKDRLTLHKPLSMQINPCHQSHAANRTIFNGSQTYNGEWLEVDATAETRELLLSGEKCVDIWLSMENLSADYCSKVEKSQHRPLLSLQYTTKQQAAQARLKRSNDCTRRLTECCRENLFVSFEDIGWDEFMHFPKGYEAYYCKGTCSLSSSANPHSTVIQRLSDAGGNVGSCCGASKLSSMNFIVSMSNLTAKLVTVPNIVVEACACM